MNRLKKSISFCLTLVLLPGLVISGQSLGTQDAKDEARQAASAADDNATSLEGRQAAQTKLAEAAELFLNAGETVETARVLNRLGRLQLILNAPEAAIETHQKALELLKQTPEPQVEVDNLNSQAEAYLRLQKRDQVALVLQRSLTSSEQSGYSRGQAQALLTLSDSQNYDNHVIALETAQKALSLWKTLDDKPGLARTYAQIGRCYQAQNLLAEATQNFEEVRKIWQELNNLTEQASVLINLGFIEYRKGDWQTEISYLAQAQALINENAEPAMMGSIASGLAEAFNESGLPEVGLGHYQRALEYFRPTHNSHAIAYLTFSIGRTYYLLARYPEAIAQLREALAISEPGSTDAAASYQYLGRVYIATQQHAAGLENLEKALVIYQRQINPREVAFVRGLLGQIYDQQGQLERAREYYQQALSTFNNLSDRLNEASIDYALARLEMKQSDYAAAEDHLQQSIKLTEDLRRVSTSYDLALAFSASVHERYEAYIECLMRKHSADPAQRLNVRAFETSELARGRSLAELLRSTQTNLTSGVDPELAQHEKLLRQSLRVKENFKVSLLAKQYSQEELKAVDSELTRLETEYKQVTETITARYPSYAQVTKPLAWTLPQIQGQVVADDQTLLLEYSLGAERSYLWAVSRTELLSYELPGRAEIENEARRFYDLLTASQPKPGMTFDLHQERVRQAEQQLPAVTATLSRLLLGPVADKLGTKRLLIVADGPLQYIPFQALALPDKTDPSTSHSQVTANQQRPLITDHEIINEPSASILALVLSESANRVPRSNSVAVLADPVFEADDPRITSAGRPGSGSNTGQGNEIEFHQALRDVNLLGDGHIPRLLASRDEADAIMLVTPWRSGFQAMDFEASRATVMKTDLSEYRIIHFATHGLLNNQHPELSGVVLSLFDRKGQPQDGFLRLHDIYNLKLPVDLVVLSACNTGLGKDVKGEGLIGLTRGFMYAGASSVVASLWKVDDEATAELMRLFYGYMLRDGLSAAAALRKAQVTMSQQKRWQAPYYWAGFVIQGQYLPSQRVSRFPFPHLALWLVLAAVVSAAGLYALRRRRKIIV